MTDHHRPSGCAACDQMTTQREGAAYLAVDETLQDREDFLRALSHELRGPLNVIRNWVHLLRSGKLDDAMTARALDRIDRSVRAEAQLVGEMLDLSRRRRRVGEREGGDVVALEQFPRV